MAKTIAATQAPDYPALPVAAAGQGRPAGSEFCRGRNWPGGIRGVLFGCRRGPPGRFVPVRPGELDVRPPEQPAGTWISPQTWALVLGLVAVWLLAWYMLQPPSADSLYRRIQRQTEDESAAALEQAEDDIHQFLARFPHDSRSERPAGLRRPNRPLAPGSPSRPSRQRSHRSSILLPVERTYLDALATARIDPEAGIAKFEAMIDLFGSPGDTSGPNGRCIQLARQRLSEFRQQYEVQSQEQRNVVEDRINRADELRKTDPRRAIAIYRAVLASTRIKPGQRTPSPGPVRDWRKASRVGSAFS